MTGQAKVCSWKPFHIFFALHHFAHWVSFLINMIEFINLLFWHYQKILTISIILNASASWILCSSRIALFVELKEMGILDSFIKAFYFGRNGGRWEELIAKIRFLPMFWRRISSRYYLSNRERMDASFDLFQSKNITVFSIKLRAISMSAWIQTHFR